MNATTLHATMNLNITTNNDMVALEIVAERQSKSWELENDDGCFWG